MLSLHSNPAFLADELDPSQTLVAAAPAQQIGTPLYSCKSQLQEAIILSACMGA